MSAAKDWPLNIESRELEGAVDWSVFSLGWHSRLKFLKACIRDGVSMDEHCSGGPFIVEHIRVRIYPDLIGDYANIVATVTPGSSLRGTRKATVLR